MSKNGKLLFRDYDPYITSNFGYRIHPITGVNTLHTGVDYGTNNKKLPTYAIEDGKVVKTGFNSGQGNYVYVSYSRILKTGLYQHLDSISVKEGDNVSSNTIIGYTGETGEVTGIHLHFAWFNSSELNKGWYERNWEDFEKYEYIKPLDYLGSNVERDKNKDQIEVVINNLRVRKLPNGEILGYIKPGIYNIIDTKVNGDYTWYKIGYNMWIAYSSEFANLYLKEENVLTDEIIEEVEDKESNDNNQEKEETIEEDVIIDEENAEIVVKNNFFSRIFASFYEFFQKILNFFRNI